MIIESFILRLATNIASNLAEKLIEGRLHVVKKHDVKKALESTPAYRSLSPEDIATIVKIVLEFFAANEKVLASLDERPQHLSTKGDKMQAKHWPINEVPPLIDRIYDQILNRPPDRGGLITYGALLNRGENSVREVIRIIGLSQEYRERFISSRSVDEAVELCYKHFLGREVDDVGKAVYRTVAEAKGFEAVITSLIDSDEYRNNFGEDAIPRRVL